MAKVQKGICPNSNRVLLWTDCYGHNLDYLLSLVEELRKDIPNALHSDIQFVDFDNSHRKGIVCLVLAYNAKYDVPNDYKVFDIDWVRLTPY